MEILQAQYEEIVKVNKTFAELLNNQTTWEKLGVSRPRVDLTQKEFLDHAYELSRGLGVIDYYQTTYECIVNTSVIVLRY